MDSDGPLVLAVSVMLHDLDRSLEALLRGHMPPDLIAQTSITFATPGKGFPPPGVSLPAINLFLYDLQENGEYRSTRGAWEERPDRTHARRPPPVRVDCHYLVTAWAPDGAPNPEHDEHRLLGAAMGVLLRFRELPRSVMFGALASSPHEVRASALRSESARSLGELWSALGGAPRPAFNFRATIALAVAPDEEGGPSPESVRINIGRRHDAP